VLSSIHRALASRLAFPVVMLASHPSPPIRDASLEFVPSIPSCDDANDLGMQSPCLRNGPSLPAPGRLSCAPHGCDSGDACEVYFDSIGIYSGVRSTPLQTLTLTSWRCNHARKRAVHNDPLQNEALHSSVLKVGGGAEPPHTETMPSYEQRPRRFPPMGDIQNHISNSAIMACPDSQICSLSCSRCNHSSIRPKTPSSSSSLRARDRMSKSSSSPLSSILTSSLPRRSSPRVKLSG